jgi:hypothetical protein
MKPAAHGGYKGVFWEKQCKKSLRAGRKIRPCRNYSGLRGLTSATRRRSVHFSVQTGRVSRRSNDQVHLSWFVVGRLDELESWSDGMRLSPDAGDKSGRLP